MKERLIDKLKSARKAHELAHISIFNDGEIRKDENSSAKRINDIHENWEFDDLERTLCDATSSYSKYYDFDSISMNLLFGLIFDANDVDENNAIKEDAEPIKGIVRYYTGSINATLDNHKVNNRDYAEYGLSRQGYVHFDKFLSLIKESGLDYNGPETFQEFKEMILTCEPFDITISADLNKKEEKKEQAKKFLKLR